MDSAVIAGIVAAKTHLADNQNQNTGEDALNAQSIEAGRTTALKVFSANIKSDDRLVNLVTNATLDIVDNSISSKMSYTVNYKLAFGSFINLDTFELNNKANAIADLPTYLNVTIVMDNSSSMGIGADQSNIDLMKLNMTCEFACHVNNHPYYDLAHSFGAVLRIDIMREAISNMLRQANILKATPDLFQFSLHTFSNSLVTVQNQTIDYDLLANAMNNIVLTTIGGGTNFHYALSTQLPPLLTTSDDGKTAVKRKSHVILVTDAVEDCASFNTIGTYICDLNYVSWLGNGTPSVYHNIQGFDPSICNAIKDTGATVTVLHVTYSIPSPLLPSDTGYVVYEDIKNKILSFESTTIKGCASDSSRYYSANSPAEIKAATSAIFNQISKPIRLTN